jgi:hypothetical protein
MACMGVCLSGRGKLTVTDMDTIEKSNLNRQFLFRDKNIGEAKSTTACSAALAMNPLLNVKSFSVPVGPDTENVFDSLFWKQIDVAVNALDTWQARLYVDSKCVEFKKPLLESGTLGATGHTQVCFSFCILLFHISSFQRFFIASCLPFFLCNISFISFNTLLFFFHMIFTLFVFHTFCFSHLCFIVFISSSCFLTCRSTHLTFFT